MEARQNTQFGSKPKAYHGEVVYIYAYDLAYDMKRQSVETILSQPTKDYLIGPSKRIPRQMFFYRPQMAVFPPQTRQTAGGETVKIRKSIKLFSIGAISIQVRVPFSVERLDDLVDYHDLKFAERGLAEEINDLAEEVRRDIEPYCIRPVPNLTVAEAYTVFCLAELPRAADGRIVLAEEWLMTDRRQVAGLLTQEQNAAKLSEQEVAKSTERYVSYYDSDLVVVHWDSALVVGEQEAMDDVLHVMELANVQHVELAAYDRILDDALQVSYRDVAQRRFQFSGQIHRNLREIRIDLARLGDELSNITKFFGDWHLAKIHSNLSRRLHLPDWHRIIDQKIETLGDLYDLLQQDRFNLLMFLLDVAIVLLFIIDVIILLVGPQH